MKAGMFGAIVLALALTVSPAGAGPRHARYIQGTAAFWHRDTLAVRTAKPAQPALRLRGRVRAFTLQRSALKGVLAKAPVVIALPAPDGSFQRFALTPSAIMAPGLARKHPDIKTYAGRGIDDRAATIHADLSHIGFHASVRSPHGGWYIDPYFRNSQQRYVSYSTRQVVDTHGPFVEREIRGEALRDVRPGSTGDQLRTYRLALLTDPGYATYFGGSANVTAAKVALINRVSQVYEDETSIRLQLIANDDLLNLDTAAQMTGANGPCGGSPCYTAGQATSCTGSTLSRTRQVIGLLVGASAFDIGHIALGQPGGGVAQLAVVGRDPKAEGCTGLTTPVGDFFAVDYVAHEMGHQFAGNHTFNGTQSNCSGGNRNAGTSVEPGSGSSVMAYAGICGSDDLQPHSDPYWSERSFDEVTTYVSGAEANIAEVQMGVLTGFNTNGQQFQLRYQGNDSAPIVRGTNFSAAGIEAAIEGISGWPAGGTATVSSVGDTAFTITFGGTLANTDVDELELVNCTVGCTGYVGEIAKGGLTTRGGTVSATGDAIPTVTAPAQYTIPLRTPFELTASGSDADGDTLTYMWEQNDRGGSGTGLVDNTKVDGPLFRQFGLAALVSDADALQYNSPGENAASTDPTRVFPDLQQILDNNTNAEAGTCPPADNPPTQAQIDCFSEFLPNLQYVGLAGVNQSPLSLHFRVTVRDGHGGVNSNAPTQTTLLLDTHAGPFLVTSPNTAVTWAHGTTQTVTWDPAGTNANQVNAADVAISLSVDGGHTYPYVLAASTPNDGSESITVPEVGTDHARVKVEGVGNVFFDVSNADFTITAPPPPPPPPPVPPPPPPVEPPPPSPHCVVPRVIGLTLTKAKARIRRAHCRTGKVTKKFSSRRLKNHVLKQRPKKGTRLPNGGRVSLTVGKGPRR